MYSASASSSAAQSTAVQQRGSTITIGGGLPSWLPLAAIGAVLVGFIIWQLRK